MNVGLYSGAAGMRMGQDYQELVTENLAMQSVPGYKQTLPVFSTDPNISSQGSLTPSGNPAAVRMTRVVDFSQGPIQPAASPYNMAIEGKGFFAVHEADGSTSYTRNGAFQVSPTGELQTSDGASVLGQGGSALTMDPTKASMAMIGTDGTISINGQSAGRVGVVHFDHPSKDLTPIDHGRYSALPNLAQEGMAPGDQVMGHSLEGSNGNAVEQMADMIQAVRLYEANSKAVAAADDSTNQLITTIGGHSS